MNNHALRSRLLCGSLAAVMAAGLCACGGEKSGVTETEPRPEDNGPALQAKIENLELLRKTFEESFPYGAGVYLADLDHDGLKDAIVLDDQSGGAAVRALVCRDGECRNVELGVSDYYDAISGGTGLVYAIREDPQTGFATLLEYRGGSADGYGNQAFFPLTLGEDLQPVWGEPFGQVVPEGADVMDYPINEAKVLEMEQLCRRELKDTRTFVCSPYYQDKRLLDSCMGEQVNLSPLVQLGYEYDTISVIGDRVSLCIPKDWAGKYELREYDNPERQEAGVTVICSDAASNGGMLMSVTYYMGGETGLFFEDHPGLCWHRAAPLGELRVFVPTDVQFGDASAEQYNHMADAVDSVARSVMPN